MELRAPPGSDSNRERTKGAGRWGGAYSRSPQAGSGWLAGVGLGEDCRLRGDGLGSSSGLAPLPGSRGGHSASASANL